MVCKMRLTIKRKLFGLTICSLLFVAGVSAAGYWGITSVEKTMVEVAATGAAIRNHVEAGTYNDMTRDDISAIFAKKGQEQQDSLDNLALHSKMLAQRVTAARDAVTDPVLQATLNEEVRLVQEYVSAADTLAKAIAHDRSSSATEVGRLAHLYKGLQEKIEESGDQLEQGAKQSELGATQKGARATISSF
jgi:CHASE3 domain sensor protein